MLKKNPWVLGVCLVALGLAPALPAAESAKEKAPAKSESVKEKDAAADDKKEAAAATDEGKAGHKSPGLATTLAFVPGIAIHGTGHMYAGSWMKGLGLLAIEGAAVGFGATAWTNGGDSLQAILNSNGKFPTDVSKGWSNLGILTVSGMAFLWTWFDDMAGASIAANEYNKLADASAQAHLRLQPRLDGAQLALSTNF